MLKITEEAAQKILDVYAETQAGDGNFTRQFSPMYESVMHIRQCYSLSKALGMKPNIILTEDMVSKLYTVDWARYE